MITLTSLLRLFKLRKPPNHTMIDNNNVVENEVKPIEILQTMQWSKLCWDASWEDVIEIETLLPKIGQKYPIKFDENEDFVQEGLVFILWQPPHSDLNGWYDKRPSEILKSYIIEGFLTDLYSDYETREITCSFKVSDFSSLVSYFYNTPETQVSPLSSIGQGDGSSRIQWRDAQYIQKYHLGKFLYLSVTECETGLELILSYRDDKICIHYSATLHHPAHYETLITNYYLNEKEQKLIEGLINKATEIIDISYESLTDNQIRGVEYW